MKTYKKILPLIVIMIIIIFTLQSCGSSKEQEKYNKQRNELRLKLKSLQHQIDSLDRETKAMLKKTNEQNDSLNYYIRTLDSLNKCK